MSTALDHLMEQLMQSLQVRIGGQQTGEDDSLGGFVLSHDDVSVFGAPSQGNEWEVRLNSHPSFKPKCCRHASVCVH
jgi:hypothetical protein